jgi:ABC-type nitrate/sulfonate/bicarbonate transport system ATPase subunit
MSPAGVRDRLELDVRARTYLCADGRPNEALRDVPFARESGQVGAIVGPGCGKTTPLRRQRQGKFVGWELFS